MKNLIKSRTLAGFAVGMLACSVFQDWTLIVRDPLAWPLALLAVAQVWPDPPEEEEAIETNAIGFPRP